MDCQARPDRPRYDGQRLFRAAQYFLRHRDYPRCRHYALKAQNSNPNHPGPAQILAISAVLSAHASSTRPDWYSILNLPRFTQELNAIAFSFNSLRNLLNPKNSLPFAAEARDWVLKAWYVLSDPNRKAQFDRELRMEENGGSDCGSFWTACPYCYYMYEYEKMYENCCLRCQNDKCRRAFEAVPVASAAVPPPEVVEKGEYFCYGFTPVGPAEGKTGGEVDGWKWWNPLVSMGSGAVNNQPEANVMTNEKSMNESPKNDVFIEISDDEKTEGKLDGDEIGKTESEKVEEEIVDNRENGVGKVVMKRKKMMARTTKKIMGRGIRVEWNKSMQKEDNDDEDTDSEVNDQLGGEDGEGSRSGSGGAGTSSNGDSWKRDVSDAGGLEFDDIFVGLDSDMNLAFEK